MADIGATSQSIPDIRVVVDDFLSSISFLFEILKHIEGSNGDDNGIIATRVVLVVRKNNPGRPLTRSWPLYILVDLKFEI